MIFHLHQIKFLDFPFTLFFFLCSEEHLSVVAEHLLPTDAVALHYRHVGISVSRAVKAGKPLENVIMDRARG